MTDPTLCPLCGGKVHPKGDEPHQGLPRCGRCGAVKIKPGTWVYECVKCRERVTELHGYMVPHLCKECFDRTVEYQEAAGFVCNECGKAQIDCWH
jgi:hypothetical protein